MIKMAYHRKICCPLSFHSFKIINNKKKKVEKNLLAAPGFEPVPWWGFTQSHNDSHVEDIVQC